MLTFFLKRILLFLLLCIFIISCKKVEINRVYGEVFYIDETGTHPCPNKEVELIQSKASLLDTRAESEKKQLDLVRCNSSGVFDFGDLKVKKGKRILNYLKVQTPEDGWYLVGACVNSGYSESYPALVGNYTVLELLQENGDEQHFTFRFHKKGLIKVVTNKPNVTSVNDTTWLSINGYNSVWDYHSIITGDWQPPYGQNVFNWEALASTSTPITIKRFHNGITTVEYDTISVPWSDTVSYMFDF